MDPGLGDPLLKDLSILGFVIVEERLAVHRLIKLAFVSVDSHLAEQRIHAKRARFVGNDGHDPAAQLLVLEQQTQQSHERHGGRYLKLCRSLEQFAKELAFGRFNYFRRHASVGQEAAEVLATFLQITAFRTVLRRPIERRFSNDLVVDGDVEAGAELAQLLLIHLLLLMGDVASLTRFTETIALDGLGKDHGGGALVLHRSLVGCVDLAWIVATAQQLVDLRRRSGGSRA